MTDTWAAKQLQYLESRVRVRKQGPLSLLPATFQLTHTPNLAQNSFLSILNPRQDVFLTWVLCRFIKPLPGNAGALSQKNVTTSSPTFLLNHQTFALLSVISRDMNT